MPGVHERGAQTWGGNSPPRRKQGSSGLLDGGDTGLADLREGLELVKL